MKSPLEYRSTYPDENEDNIALYKISYARWMIFCHVPTFCDSMPKKRPTLAFGGMFIKQIAKDFGREISTRAESIVDDDLKNEKEKCAKRLPKFFADIVTELENDDSNLWKIDADSLLSERCTTPETAAVCDSNLDLEEDHIPGGGPTPVQYFFSTPKRPVSVLSPRTPDNSKRVQ